MVAVVVDSVVTSAQSCLERRVGDVVVGFKLKRVTWVDHQGFLLVLASSSKGNKRRCESGERQNVQFIVLCSPRFSAAAVSEPLEATGMPPPIAGSQLGCPYSSPCSLSLRARPICS